MHNLRMIFGAGLSKAYWGEAVATAVYKHNHTGIASFERRYKKKPDVSDFKVLGCVGYTLV